MARKKELKTVNLEDLRSSDPFQDGSLDEEIVVYPGVSLKELDTGKKAVGKSLQEPKSGSLYDPNIHEEEMLRKRRLEGMDGRKRFDRKKTNWRGILIIFAVFLIGYLLNHSREISSFFIEENKVKELAENMPLRWLFGWVGLFGSYYPLVCLALAAKIPLKKETETMFEIFFEGMNVPSELSPSFRSVRRRVLWRQIHDIHLVKAHGTPCARLLGANSVVLGEARLDVDDPKSMRKAIERFAPKNHVIRKLINN